MIAVSRAGRKGDKSQHVGTAGQGGFDVLPGRSGSGALAELSSEEVARLAAGLSALALQYDKVVLDLGAGIEANCMRLARAADNVPSSK